MAPRVHNAWLMCWSTWGARQVLMRPSIDAKFPNELNNISVRLIKQCPKLGRFNGIKKKMVAIACTIVRHDTGPSKALPWQHGNWTSIAAILLFYQRHGWVSLKCWWTGKNPSSFQFNFMYDSYVDKLNLYIYYKNGNKILTIFPK